MGIKDLRMLGFHDKTLEFEDVDFVADKIEAIIQEVNHLELLHLSRARRTSRS